MYSLSYYTALFLTYSSPEPIVFTPAPLIFRLKLKRPALVVLPNIVFTPEPLMLSLVLPEMSLALTPTLPLTVGRRYKAAIFTSFGYVELPALSASASLRMSVFLPASARQPQATTLTTRTLRTTARTQTDQPDSLEELDEWKQRYTNPRAGQTINLTRSLSKVVRGGSTTIVLNESRREDREGTSREVSTTQTTTESDEGTTVTSRTSDSSSSSRRTVITVGDVRTTQSNSNSATTTTTTEGDAAPATVVTTESTREIVYETGTEIGGTPTGPVIQTPAEALASFSLPPGINRDSCQVVFPLSVYAQVSSMLSDPQASIVMFRETALDSGQVIREGLWYMLISGVGRSSHGGSQTMTVKGIGLSRRARLYRLDVTGLLGWDLDNGSSSFELALDPTIKPGDFVTADDPATSFLVTQQDIRISEREAVMTLRG